MNTSTLRFNNVELKTIAHNGQIWLTSVELAKALGYADFRSITNIFNRNKDEFSASMTTVLRSNQIDYLGKSSGLQHNVRVFSLRGCHLISMFAKTIVAKCFRVWVLDISDKEVGEPIFDPINNPTPSDAYFAKHGHREYITEPMRLHLKHHVSTMIRESNLTPQGIFKKFCIHFGIKSGGYEFLPIEKYPAACAYFGIKPIFEPEHTNRQTFVDKSELDKQTAELESLRKKISKSGKYSVSDDSYYRQLPADKTNVAEMLECLDVGMNLITDSLDDLVFEKDIDTAVDKIIAGLLAMRRYQPRHMQADYCG